MSNAVWIAKDLLNTLIGRTKNIKVSMSEAIMTPSVKCYGVGLSAGINIDLPKASGGGGTSIYLASIVVPPAGYGAAEVQKEVGLGNGLHAPAGENIPVEVWKI